MSLRTFKPVTVKVPYTDANGESSLQIRGLSLQDLTTLISAHVEDLEAVAEAVMGAMDNTLTPESISVLMATVLRDFPDLVANAIALAADEPDAADAAALLPMSTQVAALRALVSLSFDEVMTIKKLIADMANGLGAMRVKAEQAAMMDLPR